MRKATARPVMQGRPFAPVEPDLFAELAEDPARQEIAAAALAAGRLGFDVTDPGVRATVIAAGRRDWAAAGAPDREPVEWLRPDPPHHPDVVYYFRLGPLVKIGTSRNIRARYETLRPEAIDAVEFGDAKLERIRHAQFGADHQHAEWFRRSPALDAHIGERFLTFYTLTGESCAAWLRRHIPLLPQ
jgi:hypothetical protein